MSRDDAWETATKKTKNWTAPGPDCLHGYWWKVFGRMRTRLKELMWEVMDGAEVSEWMVKGRTILIPKPGCTGEPEQYRPITCLNTAYKLYTGALAAVLTQHAIGNQLLPPEQKALRKGRRGCLDALVIDGAVTQEAKLHRRDLSVAWIDYKKAFDMTPHVWLTRMLKSIRPPTAVRKAIIALIPHWKTTLTIATVGGTASFQVAFERGLFQGDALSPILFCLSIAPLSHGLRKMRGFQGRHQTVSHLLFMDDLKIFAESREDLRKATMEGWKVSTALGMQFGLGKCAVAHAKAGRIAAGDALRLQSGATIPNVQYGETYRYLGIAQLFGVNLDKTKETIRREYLGRIRRVWSGHT